MKQPNESTSLIERRLLKFWALDNRKFKIYPLTNGNNLSKFANFDPLITPSPTPLQQND